MDAFSKSWWDSKTLTLDGVDTRAYPGTPRLNWIRWRLMDDLLHRSYTDIGLEVGFGQQGVELYNDPLWSPNCSRAPRYFGRLCANHVHSAIEETWEELGESFRGGTQNFVSEGVWSTWSDYLGTASGLSGSNRVVSPVTRGAGIGERRRPSHSCSESRCCFGRAARSGPPRCTTACTRIPESTSTSTGRERS